MIDSVTLFKNSKTVIIRYQSGNVKTMMGLQEKAIKFILKEDVKAFENEISVLYRMV